MFSDIKFNITRQTKTNIKEGALNAESVWLERDRFMISIFHMFDDETFQNIGPLPGVHHKTHSRRIFSPSDRWHRSALRLWVHTSWQLWQYPTDNRSPPAQGSVCSGSFCSSGEAASTNLSGQTSPSTSSSTILYLLLIDFFSTRTEG